MTKKENGRINIERGVPIPSHGNSIYPFAKMEIGDSFLIPANGDVTKQQKGICASAAGWARRHDGRKFLTRKTPGGVRVWRTA